MQKAQYFLMQLQIQKKKEQIVPERLNNNQDKQIQMSKSPIS